MGARFAGKGVLVTGGGSGIGLATAKAFAAEGATGVVAGREEQRLASAVKEIGDAASAVTVDVTDSADVARMVSTVVERHGGLDVAVNIGAHGRLPNMAAFAASKAAVSALTRTAARDHIADGVRINAVSPGATATDMSLRPGETDADRAARLKDAIPLGRVGATAEVAAAVLWLASDEAAFTVGHDLVVAGGAAAW